MTDALQELYEPRNAQLREDINGIAWHPPCLIGPHRLAGIHTRERILYFRQPHETKASAFIYIDPGTSYPADDLLECPDLRGRLSVEMVRDFRALSWLFLRLGNFEELFHVPA
jgi:hypothetical protein